MNKGEQDVGGCNWWTNVINSSFAFTTTYVMVIRYDRVRLY